MEIVLTAMQARAIPRAIKGQNSESEFIVSDDGGEPVTVENPQTGQTWEIMRDGETTETVTL